MREAWYNSRKYMLIHMEYKMETPKRSFVMNYELEELADYFIEQKKLAVMLMECTKKIKTIIETTIRDIIISVEAGKKEGHHDADLFDIEGMKKDVDEFNNHYYVFITRQEPMSDHQIVSILEKARSAFARLDKKILETKSKLKKPIDYN